MVYGILDEDCRNFFRKLEHLGIKTPGDSLAVLDEYKLFNNDLRTP